MQPLGQNFFLEKLGPLVTWTLASSWCVPFFFNSTKKPHFLLWRAKKVGLLMGSRLHVAVSFILHVLSYKDRRLQDYATGCMWRLQLLSPILLSF